MEARRNSLGSPARRGQIVLFCVAGLVILSLALTAALLIAIANAQDRSAAAQSIGFVNAAVEREKSALVRTSHDYAAWGDAYRHLHSTLDRDWAFVQGNFGATGHL